MLRFTLAILSLIFWVNSYKLIVSVRSNLLIIVNPNPNFEPGPPTYESILSSVN